MRAIKNKNEKRYSIGKRCISLVLAILLTVSLVPALAFAEDASNDASTQANASETIQPVAPSSETEAISTQSAPTPGISDEYTVTFFVEGNTYDEYVVASGGLCPAPIQPTQMDSVFMGWYYEDESQNQVQFNFNATTVTRDMEVHAVFASRLHTVQFATKALADGGIIMHTEQVASGASVASPTLDVPEQTGKVFVGDWSLDGTSTYDFNTDVTTDITLTPLYKDGYRVFFMSEGLVLEPQVVIDGNKAVRPKDDPSRTGYSFKDWYQGPEANADLFDFDASITKETKIYAHWEATEVSYRVVYWLEKENIPVNQERSDDWTTGKLLDTDADKDAIGDGYLTRAQLEDQSNFVTVYSEEKVALSESIVGDNYWGDYPVSAAAQTKIKEQLRTIELSKNWAKAYATATEIQGDGTTVLNVYVTREVYTAQYNLNSDCASSVVLPYHGSDITVNKGEATKTIIVYGKVGLDVTDYVPYLLNPDGSYLIQIKNFTTPLYGWGPYARQGTSYEPQIIFSDAYFNIGGRNGYNSSTRTVTYNLIWSGGLYPIRVATYRLSFDQTTSTLVDGSSVPLGFEEESISEKLSEPVPERVFITSLTYHKSKTVKSFSEATHLGQQGAYFDLVDTVVSKTTGRTTWFGTVSVAEGVFNDITGPFGNYGVGGAHYFMVGDTLTSGNRTTSGYLNIIEHPTLYCFKYTKELSFSFATQGGTQVNSIQVAYDSDISAVADHAVTQREGYTFKGWYDNAEYLGQPFAFEGKMPGRDITLFAKWEENPVTVNFYAQVGSGAEPLLSTQIPRNTAAAEPFNTNDADAMATFYAQCGKTLGVDEFLGWNIVLSSGSLVPYSFDMPVSADLNLYAKWDPPVSGYGVTYDLNGGSGTQPVDALLYSSGAKAIVADGGNLVKDGQRFVGWTVEDEGLSEMSILASGVVYLQSGNAVSVYGDTKLVAQYAPANKRIQVTFNRNSSSVDTEAVSWSAAQGATATFPSASWLGFAKTGYEFVGWAPSAHAQSIDTAFAPGASSKLSENLELYAVWAADASQYTVYHLVLEDNALINVDSWPQVFTTNSKGEALKVDSKVSASALVADDLIFTRSAVGVNPFDNSSSSTAATVERTLVAMQGNEHANTITFYYVRPASSEEPVVPVIPSIEQPVEPPIEPPVNPAIETPLNPTSEAPTTTVLTPGSTTTPGSAVVSGAPTVDLFGNDVPLAGIAGSVWSLFNLVCAVLATLFALVLAVRLIVMRRKGDKTDELVAAGYTYTDGIWVNAEGDVANEEELHSKKSRKFFVVVGFAAALATVLLFVFTQDLSQPMAFFDSWSVTFCVLALFGLVTTAGSIKKIKSKEGTEDEVKNPEAAQA